MMFTKYTGSVPLDQTSIDHIPLAEQRAYFDSKGWAYADKLLPGQCIPDEQDDQMYADWYVAQLAKAGAA